MLERHEQLLRERGEWRVLEFMVGRPRALEWLHSVGVLQDRVLGALVPPIPPVELRRTTADPEPAVFLWSGLIDLGRMLELYGRHRSGTASRPLRILDFGCGCGRLTRFLAVRPDLWAAHGCDVNPEHVRWCQENLPTVRTQRAELLPPAPYGDGTFDLVYCLSVFTHLPQARAARWLAELRRILEPGGLLITTTHGQAALEILRCSQLHREMFRVTPEAVEELIERFHREKFHFLAYTPDILKVACAGEDYGNAFIHPDYVVSRWVPAGFELLEHLPGGLRGWQDIVVLRRP
jgi:SAM-dependent methyltransferase